MFQIGLEPFKYINVKIKHVVQPTYMDIVVNLIKYSRQIW